MKSRAHLAAVAAAVAEGLGLGLGLGLGPSNRAAVCSLNDLNRKKIVFFTVFDETLVVLADFETV